MEKQEVIFEDLGLIAYKEAWGYQEELMQKNLAAKTASKNRNDQSAHFPSTTSHLPLTTSLISTTHYFLLCEHPPVYTLGRNGNKNNILISEDQLIQDHIDFYHINRGGDITFHGPGQIVGYPILDLEKFYTDISRYIFEIEETIIRTLADYNIVGERSKGETGVWINANIPGQARKICAIGIRCSRWITMHGFALNVNTDLSYFSNIVPCGIPDKKVTSIKTELGYAVNPDEVKEKIMHHFCSIFNCAFVTPATFEKKSSHPLCVS